MFGLIIGSLLVIGLMEKLMATVNLDGLIKNSILEII